VLNVREIRGFVLAPLPTLMPLLLLFGAILFDRPSDSWNIITSMLEMGLMIYGACLLIGVPIHLRLRNRGNSRLSAYLLYTAASIVFAGLVLGSVQQIAPAPVEENPFGLTLWSRFGLTAMFGCAIAALPSALVFWYVAVRRSHHPMSASERRNEADN
jgi:hypothetical protein